MLQPRFPGAAPRGSTARPVTRNQLPAGRAEPEGAGSLALPQAGSARAQVEHPVSGTARRVPTLVRASRCRTDQPKEDDLSSDEAREEFTGSTAAPARSLRQHPRSRDSAA